MTAREVYDEYRIMPNLQQHQLRVAAIGQLICEHASAKVDKEAVVTACLFHDMGNILKFDLSYYPEFVEAEGLDYWLQVQEDFRGKYGSDEHEATLMIAKELKLPPQVMKLIDSTGFSKVSNNVDNPVFEAQICCYADQRAGPFGVLSIEERLRDGRKRYADRPHIALAADKFEKTAADLAKLEVRVLERTDLNPEDINDHSISHIVDELSSHLLSYQS